MHTYHISYVISGVYSGHASFSDAVVQLERELNTPEALYDVKEELAKKTIGVSSDDISIITWHELKG